MKKKNIKIGSTYLAKVSNRLTDVIITRESAYGGWEAIAKDTKRKIRIKSAQRLRLEWEPNLHRYFSPELRDIAGGRK
mgnify:FL=1